MILLTDFFYLYDEFPHMRLAISLSVLILFSCSVKKGAPEKPQSKEDEPAPNVALNFDSTVYIGPVSYFAATHEFYTPLYYTEEVKADEAYDYLSKAVDSLLYTENNISRKRLPYETAQWFFKLEGMNSVTLYNMEHTKLGDAKLIRVELFNDGTGDQFIGVYKPIVSSAGIEQAVYCASAFEADLRTIQTKYEQVRNERVAKLIFEKFGVNENLSIKHAKLHIYNSVYATLDLDSACVLVEVHGDEINVVHESKEDYCITKLLPTHFEINGKPILITSMGVRKSDVMWTSLAVFSGQRYEFAERGRVRIK